MAKNIHLINKKAVDGFFGHKKAIQVNLSSVVSQADNGLEKSHFMTQDSYLRSTQVIVNMSLECLCCRFMWGQTACKNGNFDHKAITSSFIGMSTRDVEACHTASNNTSKFLLHHSVVCFDLSGQRGIPGGFKVLHISTFAGFSKEPSQSKKLSHSKKPSHK